MASRAVTPKRRLNTVEKYVVDVKPHRAATSVARTPVVVPVNMPYAQVEAPGEDVAGYRRAGLGEDPRQLPFGDPHGRCDVRRGQRRVRQVIGDERPCGGAVCDRRTDPAVAGEIKP